MSISLREDVKCSQCPIRHRAVCSRCDDDELATLEQIKSYRTYKAGETVLWRGEPLSFVGSVVEGVATLNKTLEDGRTQMLGLLLPSDFIGRPGRQEIGFDVVAASNLTLCCFDRIGFEQLVNRTPHLSSRLLEIALDELDAARDWMLLLGRKSAREKIATFVQMLLKRQKIEGYIGQSPDMTLFLTREEIANYLGLTLETVSRQLNALKNEGVLRFKDRRHFEVANLNALRAATGDDSDAA